MLQYDGITEPATAAPKRLADARELLEHPTLNPSGSDARYRHLCAAQYLAGHAVECGLKVYIISLVASVQDSRVPSWAGLLAWRKARGGKPDLEGSSSHNLGLLLVASRLEPAIGTDASLKPAWCRCCKWSPSWRYRPAPVTARADAVTMVQACTDVHNWLRTQSFA